MGANVPLGRLAEIVLTPGPAMVRDEDAQLSVYVYVDTATSDIGGYVDQARTAVMVTSTIHVLIITPVIFYLMKRRALRRDTLRPSTMTL